MWYRRDDAAADLDLVHRCLSVDPLAIKIFGWAMGIGQATAVVSALAFWALSESAARWIFDP